MKIAIIGSRQYENVRKIKNITPKTYYFSLLTHIPCVSKAIAEYIVEHYPTISSLCDAYRELDATEGKKLLTECKILTSTGKTRRIGKRASENIYIFMN